MIPARSLLAVSLLFAMASAHAADPAMGKKLMAEKKCDICHGNKTMGDASAIYTRKDRRVTSLEKLKAQVSMCNNELNLQLFPEDEEHIVEYLNDTYYKFGKK